MNTDQKIALLDKPKTIFAVATYEDHSSRDQLIQASQRLSAQFDGELEFNFSWWCFDYLRDPGMAGFAAQEAILADVVIVSAKTSGLLPANVHRWLQLWAPNKQNLPSALIGLLGSAGSSPDEQFLRGIAARAGMDYLPQLSVAAFSPRDDVRDPLAAEPRHTESFLPFMKKSVSFHSPYSHWGINE